MGLHAEEARPCHLSPSQGLAGGAQSLGCFLAGATLSYTHFSFPLSKFTPFSHSYPVTPSVWGHCSVALEDFETLVFLQYFIHHYYLYCHHRACHHPPNTLIQGLWISSTPSTLTFVLLLESSQATHPGAGHDQELLIPRNGPVHGHSPTFPSSSSPFLHRVGCLPHGPRQCSDNSLSSLPISVPPVLNTGP